VAASFLQTVRTGFSRSFWVANTLELFERFSYYASKAVLTVYLAEQIGFSTIEATFYASSVFNTLIYFLPAFAGTVVDRYGFRRSLMACFSIFSVGYLMVALGGLPFAQPLVGLVGPKLWTVAGLIVAAIGGSLIKPSIVGTCARTTTPETKALGYSIYYSIVNVGGMLGPTLSVPIQQHLGIAYVLVIASATSAVLCAAAAVFFVEPPQPKESTPATSMRQVLAGMLLALSNVRFVTFLVIFSGFWIMFWQIFESLPFYLKGALHYEQFPFVQSVGPWTVILTTIPAAALARRLPAIGAMTLGFAVSSASWFVMALVPTVPGAMAAVAIMSLGEAIQAPRYYEYVADLAPRDQVGTYMGIAFLPIAIGTFGAGLIAGRLVVAYEHAPQPSHMWFVIGGIGIASTMLMVIYDRFLAPRGRADATAA
jgi:proton-dependent oligopeptide transporter, POT family